MVDDVGVQIETPLRQKSKTGSSGRLVVWLVVISLAMMFLPLWLMSNTLQEDVALLETEHAQLSEALSLTPTPDEAAEGLRAELLALRNNVVSVENAVEELSDRGLDWYAIMDLLLQYDQAAMQLTHVAQLEFGLQVEGIAGTEDAILGYVNILRSTAFFDGVQVQSITREVQEEGQADRFAFQLLVEIGGDGDDG